MCTLVKVNKHLEFMERIINGLGLKVSSSEDRFRFNVSKGSNRLFSIKIIIKDSIINVLLITSKNNIEYFKKNEILNFQALFQMLKMFSNDHIQISVVQEGRYFEKLII